MSAAIAHLCVKRGSSQLSMTLTRFKADKRLWIGSALILFAVSFWIPWVPSFFHDSSLVSPVRLFRRMLDYNRYLQTLTHLMDERECNWRDYLRSTFFFCPPLGFSVVFGWLLQCTVVMLREAVYKGREHRP